MKKGYNNPKMEVVKLATQQMLAVSARFCNFDEDTDEDEG